MKRDFITLYDITPAEMSMLLERAEALKAGHDASACPLMGKSIGLLFEKNSTRTRVSFEVGIYQLGGQAVYLSSREIQLGSGETVADTARTLERYLNALVIRTFEHERIKEFAGNCSVPVINALTDSHHPCQALADLMTIKEKKGSLQGLRLAYIGDGNNVANSLVEASSMAGINLTLACPEGYEPDHETLRAAREKTANSGEIVVLRDPREAAEQADVLYTDVWVSMGQEKEAPKRKQKFQGYQIDEELLSCAKPDAIVMHCLPAHRGFEITGQVVDGPRSVVFDQAENRLHAQKALLEFLLANPKAGNESQAGAL